MTRKLPNNRQPFDPAKAARERANAAQEAPIQLTYAERKAMRRPLLLPDKKLDRDAD